MASPLTVAEIVWLAVLSAGLLVIIGLVYRKYWNSTHRQAPTTSAWSDAESGAAGDFAVSDRSSIVDVNDSDSVGVSVSDSDADVESLGSVSLDDDGPSVHATTATPNFRGAKRAANGKVFTDKVSGGNV